MTSARGSPQAMTPREAVAAYVQMQRWVKGERRRLGKSGERPSIVYLRRSRLVDSVDPRGLFVLLRELQQFLVRRTDG